MKDAIRAVYEGQYGIWGVLIFLLPFIGVVMWIISAIINYFDDKSKKK